MFSLSKTAIMPAICERPNPPVCFMSLQRTPAGLGPASCSFSTGSWHLAAQGWSALSEQGATLGALEAFGVEQASNSC